MSDPEPRSPGDCSPPGEQNLPGSARGAIAGESQASLARAAWARLREHPLARVGPGLITGVADDDPSGIATYSQAGAQFGLSMLWTIPLTFPLQAAIQSMCGRIGRVTGRGLAANIKAAFPAPVVYGVVLLLLIANILNISADIAAMGEVAELVTGLSRHVMTIVFALAILGLQVFVPYHRYVAVLKWLTLSLLAYGAVLFTVRIPWGEVAARTVWPALTLNATSATVVVGVFGTTISPYLFFWQASEEVEDLAGKPGKLSLVEDSSAAPKELRRIRWDTWSGMFYSDVAAFFIILATGVTLLGVGLIGVPVLAGSAGYALSEAMGWTSGLERTVKDARGFYGIIAISMALGFALHFSSISPMKALFWSAVINGLVAVPLMAVIVLLVSKSSVMGPFTASRSLVVLGWLATGVMGIAALGMFIPS
jgi:Mn2+/Fe2+ NRAMP family transporter